jgi:hypothetical protein
MRSPVGHFGFADRLFQIDGLVKTQTCAMDGYVQKFNIQGAVVSTKRRHTWSTPSIGRFRGNAGDRTFYDAIKIVLLLTLLFFFFF